MRTFGCMLQCENCGRMVNREDPPLQCPHCAHKRYLLVPIPIKSWDFQVYLLSDSQLQPQYKRRRIGYKIPGTHNRYGPDGWETMTNPIKWFDTMLLKDHDQLLDDGEYHAQQPSEMFPEPMIDCEICEKQIRLRTTRWFTHPEDVLHSVCQFCRPRDNWKYIRENAYEDNWQEEQIHLFLGGQR